MRLNAGTPEHWPARLVDLDARRPWLLDAGIVAALIAVAYPANRGLGATSFAFSVALSVPLLWRRRHPLPVFGAIAAIALAQWLLDVRAFGDVALLVALYSVAVACSTVATLAAAAVLEVGVILATARWGTAEPLKAWIALSGLATAAGVLGMSVRARRALVTSLHERAARLELERDQQGRLAAAAERARIARDMHDIVAHHLSVMIALVDGAAYQLTESPERAGAAMATASQTGRQALTEMRRLLGVLRDEQRPALAPQPGVAQIEGLIERLRAAGVTVSYELSGDPEVLEPGLQLTAHRIVQEALTNALKHAGDGAAVQVGVTCTADAIEINVVDDGVGPRADAASEGGGLRGMRERAAVYDGHVEAGADVGGGWRVRARLAAGRPEIAVPV